MKIVETKKNINRFVLYKNIPIYIYEGYFILDDVKHLTTDKEYVSEENGVLEKYESGEEHKVYTNGEFKTIMRKYSPPTFFEENVWIEYSYSEDKIANVRFMEHGEETEFTVPDISKKNPFFCLMILLRNIFLLIPRPANSYGNTPRRMRI